MITLTKTKQFHRSQSIPKPSSLLSSSRSITPNINPIIQLLVLPPKIDPGCRGRNNSHGRCSQIHYKGS